MTKHLANARERASLPMSTTTGWINLFSVGVDLGSGVNPGKSCRITPVGGC